MKYDRGNTFQDRIIDEAADWFTRMQDPDLGPELRADFADWLSASPEHVREYLMLTNLYTDIGAGPVVDGNVDLIELARQEPAANVFSLHERQSPVPSLRSAEDPQQLPIVTGFQQPGTAAPRIKRLVAVAASVVLVTAACILMLRPDENTSLYTTSVGEQKSFPLPDGSLVTLNAVSRIRLRYTAHFRDVRLLSGEALFAVAKNPVRPFRVWTEEKVIQAVGTQFNVYHRSADTTVTVVEGAVEILPVASRAGVDDVTSVSGSTGAPAPNGVDQSAVRVTVGERAHIAARDAHITVSLVDTRIDTAWRERRLTFESRPLGEVIAEFNLYNEHPLEIRDPELSSIQVSGSFNANDPQSFALFLEAAQLARARIEADRIVLLPKRPSDVTR